MYKELKLLDCQIELILNSLELAMHTYQFVYPRRRKSESREENLKISLLRDTYENIIAQNLCKHAQTIDISRFLKEEKKYRKII